MFDNGGRRTELHTTSPDGLGGFITSKEKYVYDDRSQIIEVQYSDDDVFDSNDRIVSYHYDDNGNRTNIQVFEYQGMIEDVYYYYGHENRLLRTIDTVSNLTTNYQYDPAGNCIRKTNSENDIQYSWDEQNLLLRIQSADNDIWFEYNAKGIRTAKIINGVRTEYTVEQLSPIFETLEEYDNSGDLLASYTYGTKRIGRYDSVISEYEYYLTDALGSTKMLMDGLGQAVNEYQYDIFGQHGNLPFNPYTFAGQYCDTESGLIFLRARYYDPATGRFISKDPMGVSAGLNHYVYCGNNPINYVDPSGLWAGVDDAIFAGSGALVGLVSQGVSDLVAGELSGWAEYGSAALGGAVAGETLLYTGNPVLAGIAGGATDSFLTRASNWGEGGEFGVAGFVGDVAISGAVAYVVPGAKVSGITVGRNSFAAIAKSTSTKLSNGTITNVSGKTIAKSLTAGFVRDTPEMLTNSLIEGFMTSASNEFSVGGVLIDKAAVLIGENLSDIKGATYDPASGQIIFLGTQDPAVVDNLDMDYFYTALNSVFGSAVPPFVTLDPAASIHGGRWIDFGDGDGVWEPGEEGGIVIKYTPIWVTEDDDLDIRFSLFSGVDFTAKIESVIKPNISAGGRSFVDLELVGWEDKPSDISSDSMPQGGSWINCMQLHLTSSGQESYYVLKCSNNGSSSYIMDSVMALPAKQHRKYGGRVEGTKLGWVMYEADRVMKCLGIGIDNLTNDIYDSSTISIPNYQNCVERMIATGEDGGNMRFWFVPNEMKLQRSIDSVTGKATIVFEEASVELKTESMMMGLPQTPVARDFADHFNTYYDDFAELEFPVQSPDNPEVIINVKIFKRLREAMQAVSLARFFRDNNIPVDMWWLNNWQPPYASSAKTVASAYREVSEGGRDITICGGVNINKLNTYMPSPEAESIGQLVTSSRTPVADQEVQSWDVDSTSIGDLKAVAASVDAVEQDKSILLAETDLAFASPGRQRLRFTRFYDSAITSAFDGMGAGWRNTRYTLQFSRPSWFDENDLMRNSSGAPIGKDSQSNTKLRSGEIRFYDRATGQSVDFMSSLKLEYNVDGLGHPVIELSGLNVSDIPVFSPGIRRNGSTLLQNTDKSYTLTLANGGEFDFDWQGKLQSVTDNLGYTITYVYDNNEQLISINDSASQSIVLDYQNDMLDSVTGPASERVEYTYTSGCLVEAENMRNNGIVSYSYNLDKQLVGSVGIDGIERLSSVPDLRGRSDQRQDVFGNIYDSSFTTDEVTLERTTITVDTASAEYSAFQRKFDSSGRLLENIDPFGNTTQIGYYGDSLYPNTVVSPVPGRTPISIDRNDYGQPSRITDPELIAHGAQPEEIFYDEKNLPEQVINSTGQITSYEYNTAGDVNRITRTLDGQDIVTRYEYNAEGYLEHIIDPNGVYVVSYEYDSLGRVISQFDSANIETTYVYDSLGRLSSVSHPMYSQPTTYIYNDYDQVTEIITPSGSIYKEYDPTTHFLVAETDLNGMRREYEYDAVTGMMLKTRQIVNGGVDNIETDIDYNRFGEVNSVEMSGGQVISYEYDKIGRQTARIDENYSMISLTHPSNTLCTGSQYLITWVDHDNQGDVVISLYYDTDDAGNDGVLIADNLSEDADGSMGQYLWDVSNVPDGSYYIYAEMVTSDNETLTSYATGTVTIKDADIDNNGIVNLVDFAALAASWLTQAGDLSYNVESDLDNSGEVDIDDLLLLADNWLSGTTAPPLSAPMGAPQILAPEMNTPEISLEISDNSLLYEQYQAEHLADTIAGIYEIIEWLDDQWEQDELGSMTEVEYKDFRDDLVKMLLELEKEGVRMGF